MIGDTVEPPAAKEVSTLLKTPVHPLSHRARDEAINGIYTLRDEVCFPKCEEIFYPIK